MPKQNPIPFNPDTMTVSQLKECADGLSMIFRTLDGDGNVNTRGTVRAVRDDMLRKWGPAK